MKKLSFLALAAVGLLFGACSDKDEVVQEVQNVEDFKDGAYIGISIQMPNTTATTRANEDFEDGDVAEWEVKDAHLLIFKKAANETEPKYLATYDLDTPVLDEPEDNNVTATISKATRIDNDVASEITGNKDNDNIKYYAYVILNANGQIPALTKNSSTFSDFSILPFDQIGSPIAEECNIGAGGLLMTNAPVCNYGGGANEPTKPDPTQANPNPEDVAYTTLVEIAKDKIFSSASQAQKIGNQAACVYVERAAVKITVSAASNFENKTGLGGLTINGWQIINYEPTYYNTRQIEADWGALASDASGLTSPYYYRFVSPNPFTPNVPAAHTGPYRTYFAKDLHYDVDNTVTGTPATPLLGKPQADYSANAKWIALDKSGYTTENTFDVQHQTWRNTTQVTVKVTFNSGTGFFRVDGNDGLLTLEQAKTQLATNIKKLLPVQNKFQALVAKLDPLPSGEVYSLDITIGMTEPSVALNSVTYTATAAIKNGTTTVTIPSTASAEKTALDDAVTAAISTYKASYYLKGEAYYNARIQHFGEIETPWSAAAPWKVIEPGTDVEQIYGFGNNATKKLNNETEDNSAKRFLGRYGVVRDNWYKLTIDEISELGSAEPINVTGDGKDTPDDEVKNYMSVHVHIMPWVLRTQNVSF